MQELIELKNELLEIKAMLNLLIPETTTIGYISKMTGKSRQAIRDYLINHFEPEVDFWKKDGKIIISKEVAVKLLQRR